MDNVRALTEQLQEINKKAGVQDGEAYHLHQAHPHLLGKVGRQPQEADRHGQRGLRLGPIRAASHPAGGLAIAPGPQFHSVQPMQPGAARSSPVQPGVTRRNDPTWPCLHVNVMRPCA